MSTTSKIIEIFSIELLLNVRGSLIILFDEVKIDRCVENKTVLKCAKIAQIGSGVLKTCAVKRSGFT